MKRILVVDDLEEYLNSLSRALSRDYEVVKAASLQKAKAKMDDTIALALLDVRLSEADMGNRDGILLLAWLKENYPKIPVIMMSAYRDFDAAIDTINLGASGYLKKPVNLRELKDLLNSLIVEAA
ncbi:MAG TPA: response regulator [Blastocatellia bacterium]|nr:response regulator [Blastocatellia bacterium]